MYRLRRNGNSSGGGAATATGKAGITFQMHDLFATLFPMNDKATNSGGWKQSKMRTSTMVLMKGYLPSAWQAAIKTVNKCAASGGDIRWDNVETVSDDCFLLNEVEKTLRWIPGLMKQTNLTGTLIIGLTALKSRNGMAPPMPGLHVLHTTITVKSSVLATMLATPPVPSLTLLSASRSVSAFKNSGWSILRQVPQGFQRVVCKTGGEAHT